MRETWIERRLVRRVKERGGEALKLVSPGRRGAPDRLVLIPGGRVVFAELKAPGGRLSPLQEKCARELRALGFSVYRIDSDEGIDRFCEEVFGK